MARKRFGEARHDAKRAEEAWYRSPNRSRKFGIEVKVERMPESSKPYLATACVMAKPPGRRISAKLSVRRGAQRCSREEGVTPTQAVRAALTDLGRRLK